MIHLLLVNLTPEAEWRTWRAVRHVWGEQVCVQSAMDVETALAIVDRQAPYARASRPSLILLGTGAYGVWNPAKLEQLQSALQRHRVPLVGLADTSWALERLRAQRAPLDAVILNPVQPDALSELAQSLKLNGASSGKGTNRIEQISRLLSFLSSSASRFRQVSSRLTRSQAAHASLTLQWAAVVLLAVFVTVGGSAEASVSSLPGDVLYPVKLAVQQVQLALAPSEEARGKLAQEFGARQVRDIQAAEQAGRQVTVEFEGELEQVEGNTWRVGGLLVKLRPGAAGAGVQPSPGSRVVVKGYLPGDGTLVATGLTVAGSGRHTPPRAVPQSTPPPDAAPQVQDTDQPEPTRPSQAVHEPKPTQESDPTREPKATPGPKPVPESKSTHDPKGKPDDKPEHGSKSNR